MMCLHFTCVSVSVDIVCVCPTCIQIPIKEVRCQRDDVFTFVYVCLSLCTCVCVCVPPAYGYPKSRGDVNKIVYLSFCICLDAQCVNVCVYVCVPTAYGYHKSR